MVAAAAPASEEEISFLTVLPPFTGTAWSSVTSVKSNTSLLQARETEPVVRPFTSR